MPEQTGTYISTVGSETQVFTTSVVVNEPSVIYALIDLANLAEGDEISFFVYERVDGTNERLLRAYYMVGQQVEKAFQIVQDEYISGTRVLRVAARQILGSARNFPFVWNART